ncbi:MAG: hypothetical protein JSW73_05285 [Candidatus Woesearchaeota archaeon]|nr:MAG: hypothetical protein JSW73_05285 [Candidatus Woesearchaeota archaeon]
MVNIKNIKKSTKEELPDCCKKVERPKGKSTLWQAIVYGLLPHTGCIAFIIVTILGVTAAVTFLKPIMMNAYFFYILIAISFIFAAISSVIYLRKCGLLSIPGVKKKKKYLTTMFSVTIFVNLLLFLIIFPALANVDTGFTGAAVAGPQSSITLKVDIPCPGHAPLISNELKTLAISAVNFKFPNIFEVGYSPDAVSKQQILDLDVFDTYAATVIDESSAKVVEEKPISSSGGCCCRGPTCGVAGGGCCGGY